ncbi:hypothetical protein GCM10009665_72760 [Kitasatospora nipponensis]|uniref:Phage shock protein C (PspC) family protein n=1 Tax=Kitasatospora nipponensis TaxID=258049 RepID=A0ABP4HMZ3_9ACTN
MTDERTAAEDQQSGQDQSGDTRPPLTRSEGQRVVAGVCGGLGRHLDIDPVVFRVVTAVLCLTGGLGLFLYGLAWLIVPTEGSDGEHGRTELQRVLTGRVDGQSIGAVLLTVIGTGVFFSWMGSGDSLFPLMLLGAMIFFAVRHDPERRRRARGLGHPPRPGGPYDRPTAAQSAARASALADWKTWREEFHAEWTARKADLHQRVDLAKETAARAATGTAHTTTAAHPSGTGTADAPGRPADQPPMGPSGYLWDPRHPERNPYGATPPPGAPAQPWWQRTDLPTDDPLRKPASPRPAPPPVRRHRPRSLLAPLGLLLAGGAGWGVWASNTTLGTTVLLSTTLAAALLVLGLTMLVGAKFGRARVLAVPALLVTLLLAVLGHSLSSTDAAFGDRTWAPTTAADVQSQYVLGAGDITVDLGAVDPAGATVSTAVRLGTGDVRVTVPSDVEVRLNLRTLVGSASIPQQSFKGGVGTHQRLDIAPAAGTASKGTIDLVIEVGLGDIQVVQG